MPNFRSIGLSFAITLQLFLGGAQPAAALPLEPGSLASGTTFPLPALKSRPFALSGVEVAPGLQVVNPDRFAPRNTPGFHEYSIFADRARARAFEAELKHGTMSTFGRSEVCFATSSTFNVPEVRRPEWDMFSADHFVAQSFAGDSSPKVVPVRAERWVVSDGKPHLETTLFWADTRSGGTRLISRTDSELSLVASPYAGVGVYAFRSDGATVSFLVRRVAPRDPAAPDDDALSHLGMVALVRSKGIGFDLNAFRTTIQGETRQNPCSFEHVELQLRPEQSALDSAPPPVKGRKWSKPLGAIEPVPPLREIANVVFAVVLEIDSEVPEAQVGTERRATASTRLMVVNLGLARSPNDAVALPSVSYRWVDRVRALPL
jgi:hypothetical protein